MHTIINIGRQIGSGGRDVALELSKIFNAKLYDRELLSLAAKESGFCREVFEKNDEQRGFFRSFFHSHLPHVDDANFYTNRLSQESLFKFQSDAIIHAAEQGNCVFVGRAADYVLRNIAGTTDVFITAKLEDRIARVAARHNCTEAEALHIIENGERQRQQYYNYYTGKQWGHSASYDLCLSTSLLGVEGCAKLIAQIIGVKS